MYTTAIVEFILNRNRYTGDVRSVTVDDYQKMNSKIAIVTMNF